MLCFNILISLNHFFVTLRINNVILNYETYENRKFVYMHITDNGL